MRWLAGRDKSEPASNSTCKGQYGDLKVTPLHVANDAIYKVSGFTTARFKLENSDWDDSLFVRYQGSNKYKLKEVTMTVIKGLVYSFEFEAEWSENTRTMSVFMPGDPRSNENGYVYNDESIEMRAAIKCGFEAVHFFRMRNSH